MLAVTEAISEMEHTASWLNKTVQLASTDALRRVAACSDCRRRWLLEYFGETPPFGEQCGTCDAYRKKRARIS